MTLTAHVPAGRAGQPVNPALANLGARLVDLGIALQQEESTVGQLTRLAEACGVDLCIKMKERPKAPQGDDVALVEGE